MPTHTKHLQNNSPTIWYKSTVDGRMRPTEIECMLVAAPSSNPIALRLNRSEEIYALISSKEFSTDGMGGNVDVGKFSSKAKYCSKINQLKF